MKNELPGRPRRLRASIAHLASLSLALLAVGAGDARAQAGHRVSVGGEPAAGSASVTPRSAAPGEIVWIQAAYLPPGTTVQFMMGALRDGFEVVATKMTDATGKIDGADSLTIKVPDWVKRDRPYLMIVTDANYNPLGTADMFHPTDRNRVLVRVGKFVREAAGCPSLTGEAGEIYFLTGDTSTLMPGDRVRIVGRALESSSCGKGTSIEVQRIERMPNP